MEDFQREITLVIAKEWKMLRKAKEVYFSTLGIDQDFFIFKHHLSIFGTILWVCDPLCKVQAAFIILR